MLPWYLELEKSQRARPHVAGPLNKNTGVGGGHILHRGVAERDSSQEEGHRARVGCSFYGFPEGPQLHFTLEGS